MTLAFPTLLAGFGIVLIALGGLSQSRKTRRHRPSLLYSQPLPDLSRLDTWHE